MIEDWGWLIKQALQKNEIVKNKAYIRGLVWSFCNSKIKCDVERIFSGKAKLMDEANLITACDKLIIDNLVSEGILKDDSPKYFCWGKVEQKKGIRDYIFIRLTEI